VVTVISSTFANNVAAPNGGLYSGHGGGIDNNFGRLTVINSAFYSNTAYGGGGGIYTASAPGACSDTPAVTVTNSTFSGNSVLSSTAGTFNSAGYGGGIYNDGGVLEIDSSTIVSNTAPLGGSGIGSYNDSGTCTRVGGSLIAGNSGSDVSEDTDPPVQRFASLGYNVIGLAGNNVDFTQEFTQTQDMTNVVSPLVAPLANNGGGPSTGSGWTHALLPGSPAIDHAGMTCLATDQRGIPRPQGAACDSGAYESRGFSLAKSRGDNQSAAINAAFINPLNVTLNEMGGNVLPGATITFTAPMSGASIVPPTTITTSTNASGVAILPVTANGMIGSYAVTADAGGADVVTFTLTNLPVYTLSVNTVGNGSVTRIPDQTNYVSGTIVILTAVPSATYTFTGWSGDLTHNINPNLIVMNANKLVTATFMTPPTNLSAVNDSPTPIGQATTLSATTMTGLNITYQWDFGDGNTAVGAQVSHRYGLTGWYTATVTATNGAGSISTTTLVLIDRMKTYLPLIRH
jgi:chitodextrinase